MKAAVYTRYGPPEVVQVLEVPKPVPKEHELLIRVHATTVNRTDCAFRSAEYFINRLFSGLFKPKRQVLGNEVAGEVEAVGAAVSLFKSGDQVFGYNDARFGAHAEYMLMGENEALTLMPPGMTYTEAAAMTEGSHYALCNLTAAKIKVGQSILVNGGTGAIGSAAVQLSKYFGAEVTAVCGPQHLELLKTLGADHVIDYITEDFTKTNKRFDIVCDAVGKSTFGKCKPLLKKKGIYMSSELGPGSQNPFLALVTPLFGGRKVLFPIPFTRRDDIIFLKQLYEKGSFRPLIDRTYPIEQIVEAYKYVETGQKIGNVVISI